MNGQRQRRDLGLGTGHWGWNEDHFDDGMKGRKAAADTRLGAAGGGAEVAPAFRGVQSSDRTGRRPVPRIKARGTLPTFAGNCGRSARWQNPDYGFGVSPRLRNWATTTRPAPVITSTTPPAMMGAASPRELL